MTKAVSNREICFIKAVLLLCEHGHFKKKIESGVFYHPPLLLGLSERLTCMSAKWKKLNKYHVLISETRNIY